MIYKRQNSNSDRRIQPLQNTLHITKEFKELRNIIEDQEDGFQDVPTVVVLKGVSEGGVKPLVKEIADRFFSGVASEQDQITNTNPDGSIRESQAPHPLHSDASFEDKLVYYFSLYFKEVDNLGGGASIFKSSNYILSLLEPEHIKTLLKYPVLFTHLYNGYVDNSQLNYVVRDVKNKLLLTYSHDTEVSMSPLWNLPKPVEQKVWDALDALHKCVFLTPKITYYAEQGDFIFCSNYGVLHGRDKLLSSSPRVIWRNYFGVEHFFKGLNRKAV